MSYAVFFPILIPFTAALLSLIKRENSSWQKKVSISASSLALIAAAVLLAKVSKGGVLVASLGNWPAPFGIVFAADLLSAIMVFLSALVGGAAVVFALGEADLARRKGSFFALFQFTLFGINGAFLTGDLFNLFVFFEVVLMASYVLLTSGNEEKQVRAGFNYLTLNLIGSTLFLTAAGFIFGQLGTLNMAQIAVRIGAVENQGFVTLVALILLFVFGLKSAMFPLNNWLPDAYTAPPTAVSALFAGLLTKVGVYSMYRVFGMVFVHDTGFIHNDLLLPLAGLTMVIGVWGAVVQYDISKILAFHSISQVGYILMGLSLYTPLGLAGGIFHMIHHSLVKSSLFLIGGGVERRFGSQNLKKIAGLVSTAPFLAILFMVSAMALAGIPPLSGFFSKFALVTGALVEGHGILAFAALFTGLFTLYSMIKIWRLGFWGEFKKPEGNPAPSSSLIMAGCVLSVVFVLLLSGFAGPVMKMSKRAGESLLNRDKYINAVLSGRTAPYPARTRQARVSH